MQKTCIAIALLVLSPLASADIYKCRLANGSTEISNKPCVTGSATITSRPDEQVSESARRQAEAEVEKMRRYVEKREAMQHADNPPVRQERATAQPAPAPRPQRQYKNTDECLQEIDQMVLEASQRAQLEADCRNIARPDPQPVYVPVPVPANPGHRPPHMEPPAQLKPVPQAPKESGPPIAVPALKKN